MTDLDENLLWDFSISSYAQGAVAQACLNLQDGYGARVNILLWCLWMSSQKLVVTSRQLAELKANSEQLQQKLLKPMRVLRRSLKGEGDVYEEAKSIELELEKLEQRQFWLLSQPWLGSDKACQVDCSVLADANLQKYAATLCVEQGTGQGMTATLMTTLGALVASVPWMKYEQ